VWKWIEKLRLRFVAFSPVAAWTSFSSNFSSGALPTSLITSYKSQSFSEDPGIGHLVTFSQFFFIAVHGLIFTSKFFTVKPVIAMRDYIKLVTMFFISNVCNNYAFNFNIPMPLHMIFRSGSLMANMVMGVIILKRSYDAWKYASVILITLGIIISTIASGADLHKANEGNTDLRSLGILFWLSIGILLLTVALFVSARMGIYQETLFKKYGKHPHEALFYTHIIPLPGFIMLSGSIHQHITSVVQSRSQSFLGIDVPVQVAYVIGNMLTQYMCISSVYVLTTECPSLTVTLVVTLRKFASLLFSILYFRHNFTFYHWTGALFVLIGTVIFTEIIPKASNACTSHTSHDDVIESSKTGRALNELIVLFDKRKSWRRKTSTSKNPAPMAHLKYKTLINEWM
jgi:solute carrier family 35 (UDP-xylose/UDP-N-acetylglucosamine transporter), member B4